MNIRGAADGDLPRIRAIYALARERMRAGGNPTQWGGGYPGDELIREDIRLGRSFVMEDGDTVHAVFVLALGPEPTYRRISGSWLSDAPYGTIHRLASDGAERGVFAACLAFCCEKSPNLRADTHRDNLPMQHLLESRGFRRCGVIRVADGSERLAYQRVPGDESAWKITAEQ